MENVVFDGRNIFQRRYQIGLFPTEFIKNHFSKNVQKWAGGVRPGGGGTFPRLPRLIYIPRSISGPYGSTFGRRYQGTNRIPHA